MLTDPIADMLSRIRNGYLARKERVEVPYSKIKMNIAKILTKHKFLTGLKIKGKEKHLELSLNYEKGEPVLSKIVRVSRPGRRVYQQNKNLSKTLSGLGITIISTSKGVMTIKEARKQHLGGEIICQAW